ncbi:hypothetical protein [Haloferula sp.]|uniref:hypothetical protein n=1 Tax=Haloferula sp. TaxID=2497595 RepID=UPI003C771401
MTYRIILLGWLGLSLLASAAAPAQPTLTRYMKLWTDSPFTTKPEIIKEDFNPLEDYALGGISKLEDGYYAILLNRKKPDDKIVIYPGEKSDFEVIDVTWPTGSWKDAVVTVRSGTKTGIVKFEDKLLTLKAAPAQATQKPAAAAPTIGKPAPGAKPSTRTPRPRVVVPKK